jgi:hypothetical protein
MTNKTTPDDDWLSHILDVLCDDPALLSTPEERGIAAVGYHNVDEAKTAINAKITELLVEERLGNKTIQLPNLPLFQIRCSDERGIKYWESSLYSTENLPARLQAQLTNMGDDRERYGV